MNSLIIDTNTRSTVHHFQVGSMSVCERKKHCSKGKAILTMPTDLLCLIRRTTFFRTASFKQDIVGLAQDVNCIVVQSRSKRAFGARRLLAACFRQQSKTYANVLHCADSFNGLGLMFPHLHEESWVPARNTSNCRERFADAQPGWQPCTRSHRVQLRMVFFSREALL